MKKGIFIVLLFVILIGMFYFIYEKTDKDKLEVQNGERIQSLEKQVWKKRIDSSFEKVECPVYERKLNSSYYTGKMIDTHIHVPSIPDSSPDETPEDDGTPSMGVNVKIENYICMMNQENTSKVFAFFPVWDQITEQQLEIVNRTMEMYSDRFVPFIMPPDQDDRVDGFPTVDAERLKKMLALYPGMFRGYGEIGLYERGDHGGPKGAPALPPDSERLKEIYPIVRENNLIVYFHMGEGQKESFDKALEENKDITFIFHGDQLITYENGNLNLDKIDDILSKHSNVYYGVDQIYGNVWLLKPEVKKDKFLEHFKEYEPLLQKDIENWKDFIERHPEQVLWGTDRGWSAPWSLDPEVALALNSYTRAFIARLNPSVQEKFAYGNAEKITGE